MKLSRKIPLAVLCVLALLVAFVFALFGRELVTLASLRKVDAHPLYTMTYAGDYGFDDFLKTGAKNDRDIERFIMKRLLHGIEINLGIADAGCSAFSARNEMGDPIYGRNFDFDYAPALLLRTRPRNGYASISMVNLAFAGYGKGNLPVPGRASSFLTVASPFLPFDGMNEKGVAMALLAVPKAEPPQIPGRITLNTTTAIRLVLDKAATVDEALALLGGYNLYFSGKVECHYLIADRSGKAVVVEFQDGKMEVVPQTKRYAIATNFIMLPGRIQGEGFDEFVRYDRLDALLGASGGAIAERDAMRALDSVHSAKRTQWSVVYNLDTCSASICMEGRYGNVYSYALR